LRWLGVITNSPKLSWTDEQWQWQIWVAETVGELLSHSMNLTVMPHLGNIPELIAASQEQAADSSMRNLADRLQLSRRTLNAWKQGGQVPQIESLMRLCYCCGASLYDLFTLPSGRLNLGELKSHSLPNIPALCKKPRHPIDDIRIRQTLEAALTNEEESPPSMRTVSKGLGHSPRELREHFPELCRAISSRYKNYSKVRGEQKQERLKNEVRQVILDIRSQGLYPSSRRVCSLLSEPAAMRDPVIFRFWREMLKELGQAD